MVGAETLLAIEKVAQVLETAGNYAATAGAISAGVQNIKDGFQNVKQSYNNAVADGRRKPDGVYSGAIKDPNGMEIEDQTVTGTHTNTDNTNANKSFLSHKTTTRDEGGGVIPDINRQEHLDHRIGEFQHAFLYSAPLMYHVVKEQTKHISNFNPYLDSTNPLQTTGIRIDYSLYNPYTKNSNPDNVGHFPMNLKMVIVRDLWTKDQSGTVDSDAALRWSTLHKDFFKARGKTSNALDHPHYRYDTTHVPGIAGVYDYNQIDPAQTMSMQLNPLRWKVLWQKKITVNPPQAQQDSHNDYACGTEWIPFDVGFKAIFNEHGYFADVFPRTYIMFWWTYGCYAFLPPTGNISTAKMNGYIHVNTYYRERMDNPDIRPFKTARVNN